MGANTVEAFYLPLLKSKNDMLKTDETKVPGRKSEPRKVRVFIDVLSLLLASAKRCC